MCRADLANDWGSKKSSKCDFCILECPPKRRASIDRVPTDSNRGYHPECPSKWSKSRTSTGNRLGRIASPIADLRGPAYCHPALWGVRLFVDLLSGPGLTQRMLDLVYIYIDECLSGIPRHSIGVRTQNLPISRRRLNRHCSFVIPDSALTVRYSVQDRPSRTEAYGRDNPDLASEPKMRRRSCWGDWM